MYGKCTFPSSVRIGGMWYKINRYLSKMEIMKKMTSSLKRAMEDKRDEEMLEMFK